MIYTLLLLLLICINARAQNQHIAYPNIAVKTPKAAAFDAYSDIPVSYYTGIPDISIPLYEIDVDGFKLPISLSYHASGIRVNQEATWVGLGWTLNAGGAITRQVNAADDFLEHSWDRSHPWMRTGFYDGPVFITNYDCLYDTVAVGGTPSWIDLECQLISDPEQDIFSYSIPGNSGKFLFDSNKRPVLFSRSQNIRVEVVRQNGLPLTTLKLTDGDGNKYFFNDKEVSLNYLSNEYLYKNSPSANTVYDDNPSNYVTWEHNDVFEGDEGWEATPCVPYEMTSTWLLTRIVTNKGRLISFTYADEEESLPAQESSEIYNTDIHGRDQIFYHSKLVNHGKRLTMISWDGGSVTFTASSREDIKGTAKKLDQIVVRNANGTVLKNYTFNYSYFNNDYSGNTDYTHVFKRLKLTGLSESAYTPSPGYTFDYYEGSFPAKNSKNTDYWGIQNGRTYGQEYCVGLIVNGRVYPGVSKEANFDHAVIGSLRQITYPTNGYARFTYENHQYGGGIGMSVNNDMGTDGTQGTPSSGTAFQLAVYNNYIANEHPNLPETDTLRFRIMTSSTRMAIRYNMENHVCNFKDPDYNYCVDPLLALYRISDSGSRTLLYVKECPYLYEISGSGGVSEVGEGCEESGEIGRSLDVGKYELVATCPPKDVSTEWNVSFNYVMKLLDANYNDLNTNAGNQPSADNGGAGLRIAKIETDGTTRTFRYPTGTLMRTPVLYSFGRRPGYASTTPQAFIQASESKSALSTFGMGNFVGYDWVEERMESINDTIRTRYYYKNEPEDEQYDDNHPDSPYLINYQNGLLTKKETYRNSTLLKEETMTYSHTTNNRIYALRDKSERRLTDYMLPYYYDIEWPMMATSTETLHENGGTITHPVSFTYNSRDLLSIQSQTVNGDVVQTRFKYPFDMQDAAYVSMTDSNRVTSPVEIVTSVNGSVVTGEKLTYALTGSLLVPSQLYRLNTATGLSLSQYTNAFGQEYSFNHYTAHGNPQEVWHNNEVTTYLYSYRGLYPVAEIQNATYQQVKNILGESTINTFYTLLPTDSQIATFLTPLLNAASQNRFLVTSYTHKPLFGVTSITQPSGTKSFFEYDSYGRLFKLKDTDSNLLQQYNYHYHSR